MRRALPAILVTAAGLTWLLRAQGAIDNRPPGQPVASGALNPGTTTVPGGAAGTTVPGTTPTGPTTTASGSSRTVTGDTIQTRWGPVQVAAVLDGNRITDVQVLQYPNERNRSIDINSQALPILHDEAIQAQSAQLDALSGATYTWTGYTQSLQSALDKAGFHR